jgi:transposase
MIPACSAHKAPEIQEWLAHPLAHPRRARWHLHFTPTSSSWLNLVERWFKGTHRSPTAPGTFTSVPALIDAIQTWVSHRNQEPKPFIWQAAADEILEKVRRGARKALSQVKSTTEH